MPFMLIFNPVKDDYGFIDPSFLFIFNSKNIWKKHMVDRSRKFSVGGFFILDLRF